jgi:hypothetical protein
MVACSLSLTVRPEYFEISELPTDKKRFNFRYNMMLGLMLRFNS